MSLVERILKRKIDPQANNTGGARCAYVLADEHFWVVSLTHPYPNDGLHETVFHCPVRGCEGRAVQSVNYATDPNGNRYIDGSRKVVCSGCIKN